MPRPSTKSLSGDHAPGAAPVPMAPPSAPSNRGRKPQQSNPMPCSGEVACGNSRKQYSSTRSRARVDGTPRIRRHSRTWARGSPSEHLIRSQLWRKIHRTSGKCKRQPFEAHLFEHQKRRQAHIERGEIRTFRESRRFKRCSGGRTFAYLTMSTKRRDLVHPCGSIWCYVACIAPTCTFEHHVGARTYKTRCSSYKDQDLLLPEVQVTAAILNAKTSSVFLPLRVSLQNNGYTWRLALNSNVNSSASLPERPIATWHMLGERCILCVF